MSKRPLTRYLPKFGTAQCFLGIIEGTSFAQLKAMIGAVLGQTGTPQSPVNWSEPGKWIPERLTGDDKKLALRLWEQSDQMINPRYCLGLMSICETHKLVGNSDDAIFLTDAGRKFLDNDAEQLARMDEYDGINVILSEVAAKGPAQQKHILDAFRHFCHTYTTWQAEGSVKDALRFRLDNLLQRDLIEKAGQSYRITIFGLDYLENFGALTINDKGMVSGFRQKAPITRENHVNSIFQLADKQHAIAREQLEDYLRKMDPYEFEHVIKRLLEAMGYDNVQVTASSNDKGVDVTAEIEMGITKVNEVIQVKRQKSNIGQPIVNQLRGSLALPEFEAVRGSIITTGGFTKQAKAIAIVPNAPPITLIDGARLIDYLIKHDIGVRRQEYSILEFDEASLSQFESEREIDATLLAQIGSE